MKVLMNKRFDKFIVAIFIIMVIAALVLRVLQVVRSPKNVVIEIGNQTILAEVAKTETQRAKGLAGRKNMKENQGMLFIFEDADKRVFWMRGMKFPLDFIWIRGNEIRDLSPDVPASYPSLLTPREEVDKVLEVNVGFIDKYHVKIGDKVSIDKK